MPKTEIGKSGETASAVRSRPYGRVSGAHARFRAIAFRPDYPNGPARKTMLRIAKSPISSSSTATIRVSETG